MSFFGTVFMFLRKHERVLAYLLAVSAVLVCWGVILSAGDRIKSADEPDFLAIAESLAFRGEYAEEGKLTAYRAPGLVFFLAPLVRAGAGIVEVRLANAVLVGLSLILMYHLVRRHVPAPAGLVTVALIPLWPVVIYSASTIYPQTLAAFLLILSLFLIDRLRSQAWTVAPAGLAYGALILTIPVALLLLPFYLIWIAWSSERRWPHLIVFCLISGLITCSWTVRNYVAFGTFIPVATSSGYNLMAGNAPDARFNTSLNVTFPKEVYTELTGADEVEKNKILMRAAFKQMAEDPGRTIRLYLGKFLHWFDYSNTLMSDNVVEGGASSVSVNLREAILLVTYCVIIVGPLLLRLLMITRYPMKPIEVFFLALWIGAGLAYALFFTRVRFRLPFDWLIIATNAIFLATLCERSLRKRGLLGRVI